MLGKGLSMLGKHLNSGAWLTHFCTLMPNQKSTHFPHGNAKGQGDAQRKSWPMLAFHFYKKLNSMASRGFKKWTRKKTSSYIYLIDAWGVLTNLTPWSSSLVAEILQDIAHKTANPTSMVET